MRALWPAADLRPKRAWQDGRHGNTPVRLTCSAESCAQPCWQQGNAVFLPQTGLQSWLTAGLAAPWAPPFRQRRDLAIPELAEAQHLAPAQYDDAAHLLELAGEVAPQAWTVS